MKQFNDLIDTILNLKFNDAAALLDQVIKNPLANLQASLLILTGVVVITLLAILAAILIIGFGGDDDDEDDEYYKDEESEAARPVAAAPKPKLVPVPLTKEEKRVRRAQSFIISIVGIVVVWVLLGVTTGSDTMCMSCHGSDMPHSERLVEENPKDPHVGTSCVRCHEPGGMVASLSGNVPSRVVHFAQGMAAPKKAADYGLPISSSSCASCHGDVGRSTVTVGERGVRVSHKEPLEAGATCMDCHEIQADTGSVGSWTVGMSACLRCHDNKRASADCESCHTKDIAYAVHVNRQPEPKQLVSGKRCYTCHEQKSCDSCHGVTMPHGEEWIKNRHPYEATLDNWYNEGRKCKKCHTDKRHPCSKCHNKGAFPGHPINDWPKVHGIRPAAGNDSCDACHGSMARIQGRNFCGVCHPQYKTYR